MVGSMSEPENSDWAKPSSREVGGGGSETVIDADTARHDPQTAVTVAKIKALRQSIDNVDTAIVSLLAERFKYTSQVGVLKARAGFAPADYKREDYQIERLHRIAIDAGLDPDIAEMYREFVVAEAKKRHQRIAAYDRGDDAKPGGCRHAGPDSGPFSGRAGHGRCQSG